MTSVASPTLPSIEKRSLAVRIARHCAPWGGAFRIGSCGDASSQSGPSDPETFTFGFECDRGLGRELGRGVAAALQAKCERHGEAASVRCCDQLFGIGAVLVLEA